MSLSPEQAGETVGRAAAGEQGAWNELVASYSGLIWTIARMHRLSSADASDVSQTVWLRLVENLDRLQDPARVGAWLATTARRECLRILGHRRRTLLLADETLLDQADNTAEDLDAGLLASESHERVRRAFAQLPSKYRMMLELMMLDPAPSYEEIASAMGMPIGSLGPTRGRCLRRLRQILEAEDAAAV